ncbi:MAG: hypothetical protein CBC53_000750 [Alphaproteobacteria bacterium TMED93]|nr:MAG: hypothetical protein CBC53_000750 [Alphaproteobacteria bacterium TMED93]|tara:strand:+ start:1133 stop:1324 length:192 start_codon:yes stop_codon:yes gene_type:complete
MYLNIVNNLSFENKRNKNIVFRKKDDNNKDEHKSLDIADSDYELFYNSIFYGQLTQNWIKVTN